ncbi:MAG: sigma-54 dependent transcriptional regulator [Proteobacteria bacterium]|nr:sigma-54 dependent transcriptional regulator [Pseudomonadota bacterium]
MMKKILIIDDEKDIRFLLSSILSDEGYETLQAGTVEDAELEIDKNDFNLAIVDISLNDKKKDGIYLLKKIKKINKFIPVIMISGHATIQLAVDSMKLGAYEFLEKPFNKDRLLNFTKRALETYDLQNKNKNLQKLFYDTYEIIGDSKEIKSIRDTIKKISSTDTRVLIFGPSGSGKELIARTIHKNSLRQDFPFTVCNGALLNPETFDTELFGIKKSDGTIIQGFFEKSNKGTLLIDNVSDIPLETQAKILRVLTEQKFRRVGDDKEITTDVRVLTSSSKDLREEILAGNFREDLFQRIAVVSISIPSLKNRNSDIPLLIEYFSQKISKNLGKREISIRPNYTQLYKYDWLGNVRELRNLVERIIILSEGSDKGVNQIIKESIETKASSESSTSLDFDSPLKAAREQFEKEYLTHQLKKNGLNISKTAENIGMERSALHRKLTSLGITYK